MAEGAAVQNLESIKENLLRFAELAPCAMEPFWNDMMPQMDRDPFWSAPKRLPEKPVLFVSGPGRHGNHLVHSMLDNHPDIARAGGEDAFLAAFFHAAVRNPAEAIGKLKGPENLEAILNWSGHGFDKWKLTAEMSREGNLRTTKVWAGVHDESQFVSDYQDTAVSVNYSAFQARLKELQSPMQRAETFVEIFWMYLDALSALDLEDRGQLKYPSIYVGSGMRAEMKFLLSKNVPLKCVAPLRPFETFYYSFAKGRMKSDEIDPAVLQLAWEHWYHKVVDYLILKRDYPDAVCLVNFTHLIQNPESSAREICRFLGIQFDEALLQPTSMGIPTKGNSSFPKSEKQRGTFYTESLDRRLPESYWPELYPKLWRMVSHFAV